MDSTRRGEKAARGAEARPDGRPASEAPQQRTIDELRRLCAYLMDRREEEKLTLTREIHDGISQAMTAVKFQLQYLQSRLGGGDPELAKQLDSAVENADDAIRSVRRLYELSRPLIPEQAALKAAIRETIESVPPECGMEIIHHLGLTPEDLPIKQKRAIYLVTKETLESLATIREPGKVWIDLDAFGGETFLTIKSDHPTWINDGGGDLRSVALREAVRAAGGKLEQRLRDDGSQTIRVTFPCQGGKR